MRYLMLIDRTEKIIEWIGKGANVLLLMGMMLLFCDVLARYFFGNPSIWVYDVVSQLCSAFYFLVAGYTLANKGHVSMDIFYTKLSIRKRALLDIITSSCFFTFCGVLLWTGFNEMLFSVTIRETTLPPWEGPLWPAKILLVIGTILLLIQGIIELRRNILIFVHKGVE